MPWNKGFTKNTHTSVLKISETMRIKKIDNFYEWRKRLQNKLSKPLVRDEKLAFLIGLSFGDGHIQKFPRTERLRIVLGSDKPALWKYTAKLVEDIFKKRPWVKTRKHTKAVDISIYRCGLSKKLEIPSGARKNLKIKIPQWIWKNDKFLISCLRGLYEAEASLNIHLATYTYNFSFSNKNQYLLNEVGKALIYFGFHPERREDAIRLRRKQEVESFRNLISFRKYA